MPPLEDGRKFLVKTPDQVPIAVQSNMGDAKINFSTNAVSNGGVEFLFAFDELSLVSDEVSLTGASGILLGNIDGVAGKFYGTAAAQLGSTFNAGARG